VLNDPTLGLTNSDVVIVEWPFAKLHEKNGDFFFRGKDFFQELITRCRIAGSQLCYYQRDRDLPDILKVSVVHWHSPYTNPRDESRTRYYYEDELLGSSDAGFARIQPALETKKPSAVALVGSRYEDNRSWGYDEVPFNAYKAAALDKYLESHHIRRIELVYHHFAIFPGKSY
jgi:hypothetical protein